MVGVLLSREKKLGLCPAMTPTSRIEAASNATPAGVLPSNPCTRKAAGRLCGLPG